MTREEREFAKSRIEYLLKINSFVFDERDKEALEMAIQALSQEPTFDDECQKDMDEAWEQIQKKRKRIPVTLDLTPCDDAISREDAIGCLTFNGHYDTLNEVYERLKKLPSVTQKGDVKNV